MKTKLRFALLLAVVALAAMSTFAGGASAGGRYRACDNVSYQPANTPANYSGATIWNGHSEQWWCD